MWPENIANVHSKCLIPIPKKCLYNSHNTSNMLLSKYNMYAHGMYVHCILNKPNHQQESKLGAFACLVLRQYG